MRALLTALGLLTLLGGVSACGFKLRGSYQLPLALQELYLEAPQPNGELARQLRRYLQDATVRLHPVAGESARLQIIQEKQQRRILSVDNRGRASEYELVYTVKYAVFDAQNEILLPESEFSLLREYFFDPEEALAANDEAVMLQREMQQEAARLLMDRLSALSNMIAPDQMTPVSQ